MNLGACRKLHRTPETGTWYRVVRLAHLLTPYQYWAYNEISQPVFGRAECEGIVSAKLPYHRNLVIFPQKMFKGSRLEFRDNPSHLLQEIKGKIPKTARRGWPLHNHNTSAIKKLPFPELLRLSAFHFLWMATISPMP